MAAHRQLDAERLAGVSDLQLERGVGMQRHRVATAPIRCPRVHRGGHVAIGGSLCGCGEQRRGDDKMHGAHDDLLLRIRDRKEHTSELQSLMRISYAVFCLKKKNNTTQQRYIMTHNMNNTQPLTT